MKRNIGKTLGFLGVLLLAVFCLFTPLAKVQAAVDPMGIISTDSRNRLNPEAIGLESALDFPRSVRFQERGARLMINLRDLGFLSLEDEEAIDQRLNPKGEFDRVTKVILEIALYGFVGESETLAMESVHPIELSFDVPYSFSQQNFLLLFRKEGQWQELPYRFVGPERISFETREFGAFVLAYSENAIARAGVREGEGTQSLLSTIFLVGIALSFGMLLGFLTLLFMDHQNQKEEKVGAEDEGIEMRETKDKETED